MGKPCIHRRKIKRLRHRLLPLLKRLSHDMAQFIHANCSWMYYSHCVKSLNLLFLLNLIIYRYLKLIQRSSQIIYDQWCQWWKSQNQTTLSNGQHQANLVLIAYASSEGSGEPAHLRSLGRTSAARSYKQWVKRSLQTESQIPGPSEWLGMHS